MNGKGMTMSFTMWTVYRPTTSDMPGVWLSRRWQVLDGRMRVVDEPPLTGATYEEVREQLPLGAICLGRLEEDDPVIEETWLE